MTLRIAVCVFLASIATDLLADTQCDRASPRLPAAELLGPAQNQPDTAEACVAFCVPDCFCCSQSLIRGPAVLPPDSGPMTVAPSLNPVAGPRGLRPVPYRPPLDLA
jgi:hypothetical protein